MGERITFPSNGGQCEGYLADGGGPGVVVIQEWWGLVGHITAVADRFAAEGFTALAPDLFHGVATDEPDEAMRLMMGMAMDRAAADISGAAEHLGGPVGVVGFCMGGSLALWSATLSDPVRAAVCFYPAVPWERMNPTWAGYTGKSAMIHTDEHEGGSSAEGIVTAQRAIEAAGGSVEVFDYPGTDHAFFNDDRPEVYAPEAAALAWQRTVDFFRSTLV